MTQTILIVDDEADVRTMFAKFLERKGFATVEAPNVLEALRVVKRGGIDLILTDYHMPQMTGMDLLREVHKVKKEMPVVLMSGQAEMRLAVEAIREHAFDFLQKPVDSADLLKTVELALRRKTTEPVIAGKGTGPIFCSRSEQDPRITILHFNRPLDEHSAKAFEGALRRLLADGELQRYMIIGLKNVTYINNVGMNFLLSTFHDLKAQSHSVVFTQLSDPVYKYLKVLGYLEYFPNAPNIQEALTFFPGT